MEGIFLILIGVLHAAIAVVVGILSAICSAIASIVGFVFQLVTARRSSNVSRKDSNIAQTVDSDEMGSEPEPYFRPSDSSRKRPGKRKVPFVIQKILLGLTALTAIFVAALAILNFFFFEPIAQKLIEARAHKIGATVESEKIEGNLFTGRFEIEDASIEAENWSLSIDSLSIDIALLSLLSKQPTIERARVAGMKLAAVLPEADESKSAPSIRSIPDIRIQKLGVNGVDVTLTSAEGPPPPVQTLRIDRLACADFGTRAAFFYLFFRSRAEMDINGSRLVIDVETLKPTGKRTVWRAKGLPLAGFRHAAPFFSLFREGTVDLEVQDEWILSDRLEVDTDWRLTFRNVRAEARPDQKILGPAADYLNEAEEPVEIGFQLKMNPEQFEGSATEAANAMFAALSRALLVNFGKQDVPLEELEQRQKQLFNDVKGLLDTARKSED